MRGGTSVSIGLLVLFHSLMSSCICAQSAILEDPKSNVLSYCGVAGNDKDIKPIPFVDTPYTLVNVQLVIRHGDRMPWGTQCWLKDKTDYSCHLTRGTVPILGDTDPTVTNSRLYRKVYTDGSDVFRGNCAQGALTDKGFYQQRQNGRGLREYLVQKRGFLDQRMDRNVIRLHADDVPRTLLSVQSLMLGLYPSANDCNEHVVNLHTEDKLNNFMVGNPRLCPGLKDAEAAAKDEDEYKSYFGANGPGGKVRDELTQHEETAKLKIPNAFDCYFVHACHQKQTPAFMTPDFVSRLEAATTFMESFAYTKSKNADNGIKLTIGPLLHRLWYNFEAFWSEPSKDRPNLDYNQRVKLRVFSGHDTTILPLLAAFNLANQWPPYASMLALELYDTGKEDVKTQMERFVVRVVYNGVVQRVGGGCEDQEFCPASTLYAILKERLATKDACPLYFQQFEGDEQWQADHPIDWPPMGRLPKNTWREQVHVYLWLSVAIIVVLVGFILYTRRPFARMRKGVGIPVDGNDQVAFQHL